MDVASLAASFVATRQVQGVEAVSLSAVKQQANAAQAIADMIGEQQRLSVPGRGGHLDIAA